MSPIQYRHRSDYEKVLKFSRHLHDLMESGEFWSLSFAKRRQLVRRVNRLYKRLSGVFHLPKTRTLLLAAGVIALTGCPEAGTGDGTTNSAPVVEIVEGDQIVANGATATFTVEATDEDGDALSYAWFVDEEEQTETGDTFSVSRSPAEEQVYAIRVNVSDGTDTTSDSVDLTVAGPGLAVTIDTTSEVENGVIDAGETATFTASVSNAGEGTLAYEWTLDGEVIDSETDDSVDISFDASFPNDHEVGVTVTEALRTGARTTDVLVRIDPVFTDNEEMDVGIQTASYYYVDSDYPLTSFVLGDLDDDGDLDGLVASYSSYYAEYFSGLALTNESFYVVTEWFRNDGTDTSPSFTGYGSPTGFTDIHSYYGEYDGYTVYKALDLADFDGDGDADLLVGAIQRYVEYVYYGEGPGVFNHTFTFGFSIWTNDGDATGPDFTAGSDFYQYGLPYAISYLGAPSGDYDIYDIPGSTDWIPSAELVDIDDDGDLDLVLSYYDFLGSPGGRTVAIAENSGGVGTDSYFEDLENVVDSNMVPSDHTSSGVDVMPYLHAADLDLDGDVDLLLGNVYTETGYHFQFFENTGTPTEPLFETESPVDPFGLDTAVEYNYGASFGTDIESADTDGDGDIDIIAGWSYFAEAALPVHFENTGVLEPEE